LCICSRSSAPEGHLKITRHFNARGRHAKIPSPGGTTEIDDLAGGRQIPSQSRRAERIFDSLGIADGERCRCRGAKVTALLDLREEAILTANCDGPGIFVKHGAPGSEWLKQIFQVFTRIGTPANNVHLESFRNTGDMLFSPFGLSEETFKWIDIIATN
jgi:hypothetical protein